MEIPSNFKLIYSEASIQEAVKQLGEEISLWYQGKEGELLVLSLMNGALFFTADLLRSLSITVELAVFGVKTYVDDGVKSDNANLVLNINAKGRSVLVLDDICDSGETLKETVAAVKEAGAEEVKTAVLLKRVLDKETFEPDYVGIRHNGTEWFVGYGMDSHGLYRNLSALYVIEH